MRRVIASITKYRRMFALQTAGHLDHPLFVMNYVLRALRVILLLSVWRIILTGRGEVSGMTLGSVLTYALISEVFADPIACRTGMSSAFWDGEIVHRMLRPMSIFRQYAVESVSAWTMSFMAFSVPLLVLSPFLGVNPMPADIGHAGWFLLSVILGVGVGFALEAIFCALVVSLGQGDYSANQMRNAMSALLSGAVIPLALLPWGIGRVFTWLPFASMASAPLRIYTGTGDPLLLIGIQAMWAVVLWPCAHLLWNAQRERMVTYGG